MLAPPPGGTFDVEDGNLPVKNPTRISCNSATKDSSPENVPLLTEEAISNDSGYKKKDKLYDSREAMIPCILLALGGNLVDGPGSSKLGLRTTAAIVFGRLVLVPPTGLGIVMLADKLGFLPPDDKMFRFVLFLQHTMPSSVLAGAVANLRGCGREAATVLFWVHIFAIFSMAGWIILHLHLLF